MNENKPLISCIIIFFNAGEQFFIEAIESIFAQTYENWELFLVDDGSTDESTKIALEYVQKYPEKVRYLEHEGHQNLGMSATRNLGIRHANGEYIAFLDADDFWLPNTLEEQSSILNSNPDAAMVFGPIQYWYSWKGNSEETKSDFVETYVDKSLVQADSVIKPPILFMLILESKICISGMLVRRQIIKKVGGFEAKFRGLYEDQVFCLKICLQFPVFAASHCWYKYRQHSNSCCAIAEKARKEYWLLNRPDFLNWVEKYLQEQGFTHTEAWYVLQQQLWPYRQKLIQRLKVRILWSAWRVKRLIRRTLSF